MQYNYYDYFRHEAYEQICQPFDTTQTTLNTTHPPLGTTFSQPDEHLAQQLLERTGELESLQKQLEEAKDSAAAELEQVILDYEEKLDVGLQNSGDESQSKVKELNKENAELERKLNTAKSKEETLKERVLLLETDKLELQRKISNFEQEILTYQGELEQVLANQEEELDRNEQLQQQLEYASSTIKDLKVGLLGTTLEK